MSPLRVVIPVVLALFSLLAVTLPPLSSKGEAREAVVVKNMLEQDNYILPLRNLEDIPSKPPLYHWVASAFVEDSVSEFDVRAPSAIFSLLTLLIFGAVVSRNYGESQALLSILICASSFEWLRSSQAARVDMVFSSTLVITLLSLYQGLVDSDRSRKFYFFNLVLLTLSLSGAILSKGPAGGVIPLLIAGLFYFPFVWSEPKASIIKASKLIPSIILGALLASVWYYSAYLIGGSRFLEVQVYKENISRLTGNGEFVIGHQKPIFFGPIELVISFLPWSLALPLVIKEAYHARGYPRDSLKRFSLVALGVFIVICSLASSKRTVYFLPVFPLLAFLTAESLKSRSILFKRISGAILALSIVGSLFILPAVQRKKTVKEFSLEVNKALDRGEDVFQVGHDYFPTLFYATRNLPRIENFERLPAGAYGIVKEREINRELSEVIFVSTGKADDGRGRLALVRKKASGL